MKNCIKCANSKPLSEYYKHPKMSDGHLGICKSCHKDRMSDRRRTNPSVQLYDRERSRTPERRAHTSFISKRWRKNNPDGYKAHSAVAYAKRTGRLIPEPCKVCGSIENIHAHHDDYSKPLEVDWLCALHHRRHHGNDWE